MQYSYEQAKAIIEDMENRYKSGFSFSDKDKLASLYFQTQGKHIANLSCSNCYRDAFIIIKLYLRNHTTMPEYEYILLNGIVIHKFGSDVYHAQGIPNDVAEDWLAQDPSRIRFFYKFPEDWESRIAKAPAEEAHNEANDGEGTIAPMIPKKRGTRKKNK